MTEYRGPDPIAQAIGSASLGVDLLGRCRKWVSSGVVSRPALIVPGVTSVSESFYNYITDLTAFVRAERQEHPLLVPHDGGPYLSLPGLLPTPAGIIPPDSRPLIADKFAKWIVPFEDKWWREMQLAVPELGDVTAARKRFAHIALYPDWMRAALDATASAIWRSASDASVPVKRISTTGAPRFTKDLLEKQQVVNVWTMPSGGELAKAIAAGDMVAAAKRGVLMLNTAGYRLQLEGGYGDSDGSAKPSKERMVLTWKGDVRPAGRTFSRVTEGWDARIPGTRLTCRSRQLAQGAFDADFPLRCLVRPLINGRLANWSNVFLTRSLSDLRTSLASATHVGVYDVGNNDQSMGREVVRAFARRVDALCGGGGWYLDLYLRMPILARADYIGDRGQGFLSGNPFRATDFTAHYMNSSGNPATGEITNLHGVYCAASSLWVFERVTGIHSLPYDETFVQRVLSQQHPVTVKVTGDNLLFATSDERYATFVRDAHKYCLFALLERADTYAGYVVYTDPNSGATVADYNIDSVPRRTVLHDRSLDSALRGDPAQGWTDRVARFQSHPRGPTWIACLEELSTKHFGRPLSEIYSDYSAMLARQGAGRTLPQLNLTDIELAVADDPSLVEWKYSPDLVRPEVLDLFFISVPPRAAAAVREHFARLPEQAYPDA